MIVHSNVNGYVAYLTKVLKAVFLLLYCSVCGEVHRDSSIGKSKTGLNLKKYLIKINFLWPENKNVMLKQVNFDIPRVNVVMVSVMDDDLGSIDSCSG